MKSNQSSHITINCQLYFLSCHLCVCIPNNFFCLTFVTKPLHAFFISHIITWAECIVLPQIYSVNRTSYEAPHYTVKIETACYYCMNLKVGFYSHSMWKAKTSERQHSRSELIVTCIACLLNETYLLLPI